MSSANTLVDTLSKDNFDKCLHHGLELTLQLLTMIEEKTLQTLVFTLDGRLETLGAGNISTQVLLHDPVEFAEVNRKGIFVGIGKEVKREKVANGNFCCFFFRCQLRCPPQ